MERGCEFKLSIDHKLGEYVNQRKVMRTLFLYELVRGRKLGRIPGWQKVARIKGRYTPTD